MKPSVFFLKGVKGILQTFLGACAALSFASPLQAALPDSVFLFPHPTLHDGGRRGMLFKWSADGQQWNDVGMGQIYLRCDFGPWKKLYKPYLTQSRDNGKLYLYWYLDAEETAMAATSSEDMLKWAPQSYFMKTDKDAYVQKNCRRPVPVTVHTDGRDVEGWALKVPYALVDGMEKHAMYRAYTGRLNGERAAQDAVRFEGLQPVRARIEVDSAAAKPISDMLIGAFFEDLNYAADGGLYAELVQNRDFEYSPADGNKDRNWNSRYAWALQGEGMSWKVDTVAPIHANNPHYAVLDVRRPGATLANTGFDGIVVRKGEKYDFSMFSRMLDGKRGAKAEVRLETRSGEVLASARIPLSSSEWKRHEVMLKATADADSAVLVVCPSASGCYALDMISLFPRNTFKGRRNGLRADLAQAIADIRPRFVRFPGGCLAHGDGVDNIYHWKESIGPLEARKPAPNIWRYHQTRGLGYFEFFQFCEDIGAEPLPVVAAGVPCQNSGIGGPSHHSVNLVTSQGQQGGIPMAEMEQYVQDVLDLIEYANGDARTTRWGKERAKAGHPEPFHLKYIGIGNEDLISDVFTERFVMICEAVRKKYPDITVIGTTGPSIEGSDYEAGWALADRLKLPMVDEHNYNTPGWFIHNQDFYDHYDRSKSKVYLGEHASRAQGCFNNVETALTTALFLTAVERNGDVVAMTSYAPLLAKEGRTQWNPDLIYFTNTEVKPTVDYYVQQMFGQNSGNEYLPARVTIDNRREEVRQRVGVSVVRDSLSGDVVLKLVNMLPVEVSADIALPQLEGKQVRAVRTLLSGQPSDKTARPQRSEMEVGGQFAYGLPPYSFTVIRFASPRP